MNLHSIAASTALHYGIPIEDLLGTDRSKRFSHPRQTVCYLAYKNLPLSLPEVGRALGRDHTTVMHANRCVGERMNAELMADHAAILAGADSEPELSPWVFRTRRCAPIFKTIRHTQEASQ
jgi:chromosomal replication initiation ATPase DnaA